MVKIRERNEILDCTVYNLSMFYLMGFGRWTVEQWDMFDKQQKLSVLDMAKMSLSNQKKRGRRILNQGIKI